MARQTPEQQRRHPTCCACIEEGNRNPATSHGNAIPYFSVKPIEDRSRLDFGLCDELYFRVHETGVRLKIMRNLLRREPQIMKRVFEKMKDKHFKNNSFVSKQKQAERARAKQR